MRDRGPYERILGLPEPWKVIDVELRDVEVAMRAAAGLACPECGEAMTAYDHRTRWWRHLYTCQYKTIIEASVPRGRCPGHGVRQIEVPWAEVYSRFTALFEALAIDWCGRRRNRRSRGGWARAGRMRTGSWSARFGEGSIAGARRWWRTWAWMRSRSRSGTST